MALIDGYPLPPPSLFKPVPTRDIHFDQFDFKRTWFFILRRLVAPVVQSYWPGYTLSGKVCLDFIVKYEAEGQPFLRPHHDASTFSLNVALNRVGARVWEGPYIGGIV